jgi:hypothetical protein
MMKFLVAALSSSRVVPFLDLHGILEAMARVATRRLGREEHPAASGARVAIQPFFAILASRARCSHGLVLRRLVLRRLVLRRLVLCQLVLDE